MAGVASRFLMYYLRESPLARQALLRVRCANPSSAPIAVPSLRPRKAQADRPSGSATNKSSAPAAPARFPAADSTSSPGRWERTRPHRSPGNLRPDRSDPGARVSLPPESPGTASSTRHRPTSAAAPSSVPRCAQREGRQPSPPGRESTPGFGYRRNESVNSIVLFRLWRGCGGYSCSPPSGIPLDFFHQLPYVPVPSFCVRQGAKEYNSPLPPPEQAAEAFCRVRGKSPRQRNVPTRP